MYLAVRGVEFDDAVDALRDSDLVWLIPALPVFAAAIVLRGVRWWALYDAEQRPPLRAVMYALLVGYFFNNILPARAGEAARVIALNNRARTPLGGDRRHRRRRARLRPARAAAAPAVRLPLAAGDLVAAQRRHPRRGRHGDPRGDDRAHRALRRPRRALAAQPAAAHPAPRLRRARRGRGDQRDARARRPAQPGHRPARLRADLRLLVRARALLLDPHGRPFTSSLPLDAAILVTVAINLSLVLPSSPAALGVFEAATIIALNAFDVPHAEALSYALVLHLLNLVPFLLIGAVLLGPAALRRNR